jgi:hypothetical protein
MEIYIAEKVAHVRALFAEVSPAVHVRETVLRYLAALEAGYRKQHPAVGIVLRNHSPAHLSSAAARDSFPTVTPQQLREVAAHYFGFARFAAIDQAVTHDPVFEAALDFLLRGDETGLAAHLADHPAVVEQSSSFGHRAGLIHYLAANGVELHRQVVPANAPDLLRLLLDRGADPDQEHRIYGGRFSLRALIETSAHPAAAGVSEALLALLK